MQGYKEEGLGVLGQSPRGNEQRGPEGEGEMSTETRWQRPVCCPEAPRPFVPQTGATTIRLALGISNETHCGCPVMGQGL